MEACSLLRVKKMLLLLRIWSLVKLSTTRKGSLSRILNCKRTTGAGLAGLRVVYGAFPLSIIEYLWRAKQPYNVSVAAEISACPGLQNPTYLEKVKDTLVQERDRLYNLPKEVPFLNPYPSYSNFILCEVASGMDAKVIKYKFYVDGKWGYDEFEHHVTGDYEIVNTLHLSTDDMDVDNDAFSAFG
ncbi:histidinol-phosphate aminotransferase, chloroplastic-like isoform X1 [Quercus robur]|uniref:histidinol-phosphate aminotransferase, chloroplastic-like isoform X1 n=1 Tax=Quercus robur TaxID=38942 RepID=UPI002163FF7C|nr:histidinol-phosphate aminotransferase, chloroplastic-like isoform X1 [Quercus robur]